MKKLRFLKNGSIGGYIKKDNKWVWRIIKGPIKKYKKGGSFNSMNCSIPLKKTRYINSNDFITTLEKQETYYMTKKNAIKKLKKQLFKKMPYVKSDKLEDCICDGFNYNNSNTTINTGSISKNHVLYKIKRLGKKGKSGIPYMIIPINKNHDLKSSIAVTKYTKSKHISRTKPGKPVKRKYIGPDDDFSNKIIFLKHNQKIIDVYLLSNFMEQTCVGLVIMQLNDNEILRTCILQTYDAFICKKIGFNLLEKADGTLDEVLNKNLNLLSVAKIFIQIFTLLFNLQELFDFTNSDMKSANIFYKGNIDEKNFMMNIDDDFRIKIADLDRVSVTIKLPNSDNFTRLINNRDKCFLSKDSVWKYKLDGKYKYFKVGYYPDATCRFKTTLHNIVFCKSFDMLTCLVNMFDNDMFFNFIIHNSMKYIKLLFKNIH